MDLRLFPLFIVVVLIGMPAVFAALLFFAPFIAFEQQADSDIFIFYICILWLLCAPALIMETYRRSMRNALSARFIMWIFILAGVGLPTLALGLAPMATPLISINSIYILITGLCTGSVAGLVTNWLLQQKKER